MYNMQEYLLLCMGRKIPGSVGSEYHGTALWDVKLDVPHTALAYLYSLGTDKCTSEVY
jgi:hypothetical protein